MDQRLFFVLGDLFANILVGVLAGWLCWAVIGTGWNMWLAMFLAMGLGMLVGLVFFVPLSYFWGAMEIMLPTMFSGMLSGMAIGMWCAMAVVSVGAASFVGGAFGLLGIVIVWVLNNNLRGIRPLNDLNNAG